MKKRILTIALLAFMVMPLLGFSDGFPYVRIKEGDTKTLSLLVSNNKTEEITVRIMSKTGVVVYENEAENIQIINRRFDVSYLEPASYQLEVESANKIEVTPFEVNAKDLTVKEELSYTIFKPAFKQRESGKLDFFLTNPLKADTKITVYNGYGDVVYKETVADEKTIMKRFDFSSSFAGTYSVSVINQNHEYTHTFEVK